MKGILFGGCSFTWGQGLYFYSDLPNLYRPKSPYIFEVNKITKSQINFKNTLYFPRLVANHFNTFEVVKQTNGGSEDETFEFFNSLFINKSDIISPNNKYTYDDFDYIIIQVSSIIRNKFYFNINGNQFSRPFHYLSNVNEQDVLTYMKINNCTIDDCYNQLLDQQFDRLKKELIFYESKGIKIKIILYFDELLSRIESDEFFKEKLITLNYDNKTFNTIWVMSNSYDEMRIISDPHFKDIKFNDMHPSKLLHRIIADGVINSIESDIK